jgi:hypothetical protein
MSTLPNTFTGDISPGRGAGQLQTATTGVKLMRRVEVNSLKVGDQLMRTKKSITELRKKVDHACTQGVSQKTRCEHAVRHKVVTSNGTAD